VTSMKLDFGYFEGHPVWFTKTEAWELVDGKWHKWTGDPMEIVLAAADANHEDLDLPPLPKAAFHSGG
jgi:hypothetical protein